MFGVLKKQRDIVLFAVFVTSGLLLQITSNIVLPERLRDTLTLTLGILYESIPFVIFGILLSVIIQKYVSNNLFYRLMPKKSWLRRPFLSLLGMFLPVCECGNIPLARGLIQKGLKPGEVLTFLFAAPIINPITIYTTSQAFSGEPEVVFIRVIAAFLIANFVGSLFSKSKKREMLTDSFNAHCELHEHNSLKKTGPLYAHLKNFSASFREELLRLMPALVTGSLIAGLIQTIIPRSILLAVSSEPLLAILAMLLLAFVVSICANVDAFFALSLSGIFPTSAIVAFLVFGPMIDIKILSLLRTTFKTWVLATTTFVIFVLSLCTGLVVHYAF
jgi:uncharacterized protein